MSIFNMFHVAGSALTAQSVRLNAVASNMANADSITSADGTPYRAKQVVFEATPMGNESAQGVRVKQVVESAAPPRMVYDPKIRPPMPRAMSPCPMWMWWRRWSI